MNPFETPQRPSMRPSPTFDITKPIFLSIIQGIQFEKFSIPKRVASLATDNESDFLPFVMALLEGFKTFLLNVPPRQSSPKRFLQNIPYKWFDSSSPFASTVRPRKLFENVTQGIDHSGIENDNDLILPEFPPSKETSYEELSASDVNINIQPVDSGRDVEFVEKDTGPQRVFLSQVPGLPEIKMDEPFSFPRVSNARKDILRSTMDEVRATIDRDPYTLVTLHDQESLPFAEIESSFEFEEAVIAQNDKSPPSGGL